MNTTLRQYEQNVRADFLRDNPDASGREYDSCYPAGSRQREWVKDILAAARLGVRFAPLVLDDLFGRVEGVFWHIHKDYPGCIPEGYFNPRTRRHQRQQHAEWVAARKRGRGAVRGAAEA